LWWDRRRSLWATEWDGRRCGETMPGSRVIERVILSIIIAGWLPVRWRRRRSPRCVDRSTGIPGRLAWRWRRNCPGSRGWRRRWMPRFLGAARGLNGMVVGDNTLVKAGVTLVSLQSILVFHTGCDISVVVSIIFSHLSFRFFSSLSRSR
jgi:hypothetical protein